jgi:hypothetical protein
VKKIRRVALLCYALTTCLLVLIGSPAQAGSVTNTTVRMVAPESPNVFFVYVVAAPSGTPACGTETVSNYRYVVDVTTDAGKAMVATALTAYAMQSPVDVIGLGTCAVWGDTETIYYLQAH